jgi:hypothetical protein
MQSLLPNLNQPNRDRQSFWSMMLLIVMTYLLFTMMFPPQPPQNVDIDKPIGQQNQEKQDVPPPIADPDATAPTLANTEAEPAWVTLGSMNPESPYRMLITFTNRGAAPCRIELNTTQ